MKSSLQICLSFAFVALVSVSDFFIELWDLQIISRVLNGKINVTFEVFSDLIPKSEKKFSETVGRCWKTQKSLLLVLFRFDSWDLSKAKKTFMTPKESSVLLGLTKDLWNNEQNLNSFGKQSEVVASFPRTKTKQSIWILTLLRKVTFPFSVTFKEHQGKFVQKIIGVKTRTKTPK